MVFDGRIPVILASAIGVSVFAAILYRREKARLHQERGYDAHDPNLEKEAWQSTKATLRNTTAKGRLWVDVVKGLILAPLCALIAAGMCWAGWPSANNSSIRWDMMGIAALFSVGAWFVGRIALRSWRKLKQPAGI